MDKINDVLTKLDNNLNESPHSEKDSLLGHHHCHNHTNPDDYLYGRKGPWPQPSPAHPHGESSAVVHIPKKETKDFTRHIRSRYLYQTLIYTPIKFVKNFFTPGLEEVTDAQFNTLLSDTMLSKFLSPKFDKIDKEIFSEYLESKDEFFIIDLQAVEVVKTFEGMYVSPSKTLLRKKGHLEYEVIAIYLDKTKVILEPKDGDAWELAKYFVLQGGALCATLVIHPLLHFPFDSINAITKTALPKNHILFKILIPHMRFTLGLEDAVLNSTTTVLQEKSWMPYAPYPGPYEGLRELLVMGYMGIKGNDSYPAFKYPLRPTKVYSKYGVFLESYFQVFYDFVENILIDVDKDDQAIKSWAQYISQHIPGFPDGENIFKADNLVSAVAMYMWNVSVAHTVDHANYGEMNFRQVPLRMRQFPPNKDTKMINRKKLTTFWDNAKYDMCQLLFFTDTTITPLIDCSYNFELESHIQSVAEFKKELGQLDKRFKKEGIQYIKLGDIASSVQS